MSSWVRGADRGDAGISGHGDRGEKRMILLPQGVTIQDVVRGLNAIGASPRDLITILQTIKAAGALQADLKII